MRTSFRSLALLLLFLLPASSSEAVIALVSNTVAASGLGSTTTTTTGINTTGATLIVLVVSSNNTSIPTTGNLSDSYNNMTWVQLTAKAGTNVGVRIFYCSLCTVGVGHSFSGNLANQIAVAAFSGVATSPFDVENNNEGSSVTSINTGNVTPSQTLELVIAGLSNGDTGTQSVNNGFTITNQSPFNATNFDFSVALAYKILTTATVQSATWSWLGGANDGEAVIATFKAIGGAAPGGSACGNASLLGVGC